MNFFDAEAADDATLHGLEKWTCHLYEQLGWMTLAYQSNSEDKVGSYITSIKKLQKSIESRLKIIISEDAKLDLNNLLSKVKHLLKITYKLFNKEHIRKTICDKCALPVEQEDTDSLGKKKIDGGSKSKNKIRPIISKSAHLNELSKISKKISKTQSKKLSKKSSKTQSKKLSKKSSKTQPKKMSNKNLKKIMGGNQNNFEPLIKKLSKKSSKKNNQKIFFK
jgi:hypothetical protein